MELLGLDHMASNHLRVLDFNLRVVEDIIIIVDVFNDFDRLVALFLGF